MHMRRSARNIWLGGLLSASVSLGCGTTRMTDTTRAASEMLLVSQAVDEAVDRMDFTALAGKPVYVNPEYVEKTLVDRGYLISSVRQQLLAHGALIREEEKDAIYVVELRAGGLGTDRHTLLFGSPQLSLPAVIPGQPTQIPELALVKKTDQKGVAKIGVFAYNRVTGRALWQSGLQEGSSTLKDRWVFGAGPFSSGSIRKGTELAGEPLPKLSLPAVITGEKPEEPVSLPAIPIQNSHAWTNADVVPPKQPLPAAIVGITGWMPIVGREMMR
jgi:hypothetical protein